MNVSDVTEESILGMLSHWGTSRASTKTGRLDKSPHNGGMSRSRQIHPAFHLSHLPSINHRLPDEKPILFKYGMIE
jgi:hypothetical protein